MHSTSVIVRWISFSIAIWCNSHTQIQCHQTVFAFHMKSYWSSSCSRSSEHSPFNTSTRPRAHGAMLNVTWIHDAVTVPASYKWEVFYVIMKYRRFTSANSWHPLPFASNHRSPTSNLLRLIFSHQTLGFLSSSYMAFVTPTGKCLIPNTLQKPVLAHSLHMFSPAYANRSVRDLKGVR